MFKQSKLLETSAYTRICKRKKIFKSKSKQVLRMSHVLTPRKFGSMADEMSLERINQELLMLHQLSLSESLCDACNCTESEASTQPNSPNLEHQNKQSYFLPSSNSEIAGGSWSFHEKETPPRKPFLE